MVIDTAKTILLPASLYEKGLEEDYLRFNGMTLGAGERAVASEPTPIDGTSEAVVAVMGVPTASLPPDANRFTSPLLEIARGRKRNVNILLTAENTYLVVWEKGLRVAEVLPDTSPDSLLYYMQVLGREFRLRKFDIEVRGTGAQEVTELLRGYFSNVRLCE